jgi:hypothetical protein
MSHYSYRDVAKRLAKGDWGKDFESQEMAGQAVLGDRGLLAGSCLMALLEKVQLMEDCLVQNRIRQSAKELGLLCEKSIEDFIASRGRKNCPFSVTQDLRKQAQRHIGFSVMFWEALPTCVPLHIPEKGSAARKAYDRWMRRKSDRLS